MSTTMPKIGRSVKMFRNLKTFRDQKQAIITTVLVVTGLGGATVLLPPTHHAEVAVEQSSATDAATDAATAAVAPAANTPPAVIHTPPVVTKDSNAQDIVKAIVGHGHASGLSEGQIKTVIATAHIESGFRPTVSGGVQAYGGPGTVADEVIGLFQEKASFGTVAERQDPNSAITRFIARFMEAYQKHGITGDDGQAATLAQNPQLRKHRGGIGTGYYNTVQAAMGEAAHLYSQAVGGTLH
ncbi:hypothetical protein [Mycolicibacterium thermoresistibile]